MENIKNLIEELKRNYEEDKKLAMAALPEVTLSDPKAAYCIGKMLKYSDIFFKITEETIRFNEKHEADTQKILRKLDELIDARSTIKE